MTQPWYNKLTKEEKKEHAEKSIYRIDFFTCPLCSKANRIDNFTEKMPNLADEKLIDIRAQGGRIGFPRIRKEKILRELKSDPKYIYIIEQIKKQCEEILKIIEEDK